MSPIHGLCHGVIEPRTSNVLIKHSYQLGYIASYRSSQIPVFWCSQGTEQKHMFVADTEADY